MPDAPQVLLDRLEGIRQSLLNVYKQNQKLPNAAKGAEREAFLSEFLNRLYPDSYRFSSGAIFDSHGNVSGQVDIAIEYTATPSFPMPAGSGRLMMAEGVAAVLEVKSDLYKQLPATRSTTKQIKKLRREYLGGLTRGDRHPRADIPVFAIGYVGYADHDKLLNDWRAIPKDERPDAMLTLEKPFYVGDGRLISDDNAGEVHHAKQSYALFRLIISLHQRLNTAISLNPDFDAYHFGTPSRNTIEGQ